MSKPRKRQPPLTLAEIFAKEERDAETPEQRRSRLATPPKHLEEFTAKVTASLTPRELGVLRMRFKDEPAVLEMLKKAAK